MIDEPTEHDISIERTRVKLKCGPGRTRQEFKDECDVNQILRKFAKTGLATHMAKGVPQYGDFSNVTDYQTAIEQIKDAELSFLELPANIRRYFDNNPAKLVQWMSDPENAQEAIDMGLASGKTSAKLAEEEKRAAQAAEPAKTGQDGPVSQTS